MTNPLLFVLQQDNPFIAANHFIPCGQEGRVLLGPLLKFRGKVGNVWRMSAMLATQGVTDMSPLTYYSSLNPSAVMQANAIRYHQNYDFSLWRLVLGWCRNGERIERKREEREG